MGNPTLSSTSICCSGLLKVGGDIISSLDDGSRAANICKQLYPTLRDEVMGSAPWRFAEKQAKLNADVAAPLFGYGHQFIIPSDCLRVLTVCSDNWTQQGNYILCNEPGPLNTTYLFQNTDESSWDARFAETLSWRMAMELALSLVQSQSMRTLAEGSYTKAIAQARAMNAVIGTPQRLVADIWSGSRKGYGGWMSPVASTPTEYYD